MDLYIENPITFNSDFFISSLYQNQNINTILKFMIKFTEKWILSELKGFDFNYYLMHFLKRCVKKDTIQTIATFLQQLDVPSLLKINQIIFQLSFDEEEKKKRFTYDHS